jgi:hypothetical protein
MQLRSEKVKDPTFLTLFEGKRAGEGKRPVKVNGVDATKADSEEPHRVYCSIRYLITYFPSPTSLSLLPSRVVLSSHTHPVSRSLLTGTDMHLSSLC